MGKDIPWSQGSSGNNMLNDSYHSIFLVEPENALKIRLLLVSHGKMKNAQLIRFQLCQICVQISFLRVKGKKKYFSNSCEFILQVANNTDFEMIDRICQPLF